MDKNMGPTLPMKISGGPFLLPSKADIEPIEEQPFDFSRKYNEVLEEPDSKDRSSEPTTYQDDDMPRVYCTEGTPRLISRASSVGDLTGNDKRRPETIYEQEEISLASHTATANATPRIWSGNGSPTSMNSFCMNGNSQFDAHSIVSDFSRQPSGLISPSDLPDSPGQTMPPSPKDHRPVYTTEAKHPFDYAYPQLQSSSHIPPAARFTPIALDEVKHDVKSTTLNLVRPNPEPRQMRSYADSKTLIGDQYTQEDSLHNYRTEDTPANLSAATSYSDLSSICPKSEYHGPIPKPRFRKSVTPSTGCSPLPPLKTSHVSDLYTPVEEPPMSHTQHKESSFNIMDDQKSETSSSIWKPRTLPRKLRDNLPSKDIGSSSSCSHNKSMPDLNKKPADSPSDSEDDLELLNEVINKGRPKKVEGSVSSSKMTQKKVRKQSNKSFDSGDESDKQLIDELIKLGRPQSRNQTLKSKSKADRRDEDYGPSSSSKDKFKAARSMESLSVTGKVVKKGATNFRVQEQPIRGGEAVIPKSAVARAQSLKGNKTLGYDPVHDRRQTKTPDPTGVSSFDMPFLGNRSNKPISKVSPMRSSPKKYPDEEEEPCQKSVLLSPLRSSVRQSRQVCVKKTVELTADASDGEEPQPPRPPKPPQFRAPPKPPSGSPEPVVTPEPAAVSMPDVVQRILPDIVAEETNVEEENNNVAEVKIDVPPEPPEDSGDITVLSFKFTDSNRNYTRRFLATNQFHCVLNYLACKGFPSDKYKIVVPTLLRIKKEVTESSYGKTLAELKMVPKKTLTVKPR